ncbi:MAG TPA: hypothetical protein VGD88_01385 [Opitutaceae bacterium]
MNLTFIELPLFTALITQLADDHTLNQLQNDLLKRPDKGPLIPRLRGLRKVRMSLPGRGKSSGARVIYLFLPEQRAILFFYVYTKAKAVKLSAEHEHRLRAAVETIKREFRNENDCD